MIMIVLLLAGSLVQAQENKQSGSFLIDLQWGPTTFYDYSGVSVIEPTTLSLVGDGHSKQSISVSMFLGRQFNEHLATGLEWSMATAHFPEYGETATLMFMNLQQRMGTRLNDGKASVWLGYGMGVVNANNKFRYGNNDYEFSRWGLDMSLSGGVTYDITDEVYIGLSGETRLGNFFDKDIALPSYFQRSNNHLYDYKVALTLGLRIGK